MISRLERIVAILLTPFAIAYILIGVIQHFNVSKQNLNTITDKELM